MLNYSKNQIKNAQNIQKNQLKLQLNVDVMVTLIALISGKFGVLSRKENNWWWPNLNHAKKILTNERFPNDTGFYKINVQIKSCHSIIDRLFLWHKWQAYCVCSHMSWFTCTVLFLLKKKNKKLFIKAHILNWHIVTVVSIKKKTW